MLNPFKKSTKLQLLRGSKICLEDDPEWDIDEKYAYTLSLDFAAQCWSFSCRYEKTSKKLRIDSTETVNVTLPLTATGSDAAEIINTAMHADEVAEALVHFNPMVVCPDVIELIETDGATANVLLNYCRLRDKSKYAEMAVMPCIRQAASFSVPVLEALLKNSASMEDFLKLLACTPRASNKRL